LISWGIWKDRIARVFNKKFSLPMKLMQRIKHEGKDWILAGARDLTELPVNLLVFSFLF
jgi:hypothetical protein